MCCLCVSGMCGCVSVRVRECETRTFCREQHGTEVGLLWHELLSVSDYCRREQRAAAGLQARQGALLSAGLLLRAPIVRLKEWQQPLHSTRVPRRPATLLLLVHVLSVVLALRASQA